MKPSMWILIITLILDFALLSRDIQKLHHALKDE